METKLRFLGIFGKVFLYTCLILVVITGTFFALFAGQIRATVTVTQQRQLTDAVQPLMNALQGRTDEEIIRIAEVFHEENRSFNFSFVNADGEILYQTDGFVRPENLQNLSGPRNMLFRGNLAILDGMNYTTVGGELNDTFFLALSVENLRIYLSGISFATTVFEEIRGEILVAFSLVLLVSFAAAAVFAGQIAKPIRLLTKYTRRMARLEEAPPFKARRDEIGQLATDVYSMHGNLKNTITQLEKEIKRKKEMEDNQRYFFSAASHELKTPIAATEAILEGVIENVIPVEEHEKYLQKCIGLLHRQNKLVSEILEIVKLDSDDLMHNESRINLKKVVEGILATFKPIANAKEQQIDIQVCGEIELTVNESIFEKALSNIFLNAVQNSPEEGKIRIYTDMTHENVRLCIWNSGVSIPNNLLLKLTNPFVRVDEARTSNEQGRSGLGLTIVKKSLDLMNMPFCIANENNGVLFWIELP